MDVDRFARLHRGPRPLTDGDQLAITVVLAIVIIAAALWTTDPRALFLGLVLGWLGHPVSAWLRARGG